MKKILSVMLAIMMLFGALSVPASALLGGTTAVTAPVPSQDIISNAVNNSQVVIVFDFGTGSSKRPLPVYYPDVLENGGFVNETVTGVYYMLPGADGKTLGVNSRITLPSVTNPDGLQFVGWNCNVADVNLTAGHNFVITEDILALAQSKTPRGIIYMDAVYEQAEPEEDTMGTVLGVLMKVFGTILGILFLDGSSAAGIELMEKLLGGLL